VLSLAPFIARFLRQFPKLEIDLVLSDGFVDLVEDGFEVAFRTGMLTDSRLMARALSPFLLVACASPAYLGERGAPIEPADLKRHECVGFAHWPPKMVDEWRFVREDTVYEVSIRSRLKVNNARALLAAAREGFGIVLIAQDLVRDELASGQLVRVMPDFEVPSRGLHMLYLADRQQTPKLRAFIDNAIHEFKL
jgi:DNA-binding transcriptional LysR family regulator